VGRLVFADTSALVGKLVESDPCHERATRALRDLLRRGQRLLTTDYIFDEVITRVLSVAGHDESVKAGEYILASRILDVVEVGSEVRQTSWARYKRHRDHSFSFTDCTSFVVMEKYRLEEAFTFDSDFRKAGFVTIPK
jgi:hypothetical protein